MERRRWHRKDSKDTALSMYRKMYLIRRFEERAAQAYSQGKINGFCHLYIGQEAVAVGVTEALRPDDYQMSAYRDHGYPLTRGADPGMVMAELFGRATGYCKGKGGSMHIFDIEHYFYGGYGIVGGQIPLAAGMAFASQVPGRGPGDGLLLRRGRRQPGRLPRDAQHGVQVEPCRSSSSARTTATGWAPPSPASRRCPRSTSAPPPTRMRGETVDGMDVLKVYEAVKDCAAHAAAGKGPVLLEANTYRYRGHSMSDPATYRTKDEVEKERKDDPIPKLRQYGVEH